MSAGEGKRGGPPLHIGLAGALFTKLGIDIVEIGLRLLFNEQISSGFDNVICPPHNSGRLLSFHIFITSTVFILNIGTP